MRSGIKVVGMQCNPWSSCLPPPKLKELKAHTGRWWINEMEKSKLIPDNSFQGPTTSLLLQKPSDTLVWQN